MTAGFDAIDYAERTSFEPAGNLPQKGHRISISEAEAIAMEDPQRTVSGKGLAKAQCATIYTRQRYLDAALDKVNE